MDTQYLHRRETLQNYETQRNSPRYDLLTPRQIIPWFKEKRTKPEDVSLQLLQEYIDEKATRDRIDGKGGLLPHSEVLGLKRDSIDVDAGTVTIRHTVSKATQSGGEG